MKTSASRQVLALFLIAMTMMLPINVAFALDTGNNKTNDTAPQGPDITAPQINASISRFVNSNTIAISGSTEKFSSLRLYVNDMNAPARILDSNEVSSGSFQFLNVRLQKENVIKLHATDLAGNSNETTFRVSVDTEKPEIIFDSIPSTTTRKNLTIVGTVDEPVTLRFFLAEGSQSRPAKVPGLKQMPAAIQLSWNGTRAKIRISAII